MKKHTFLFFLLLGSGLLSAQLKSPEAFFSNYGEEFQFHHEVIRYMEHVAEASDRVQWQLYGESTQGRPLGLAIVSAPANLARLEQWQDRQQRALFDPDAPADTTLPVIVWLSHGVHGNEPGATASALQNLYQLARADRFDLAARLENMIVIVDPCLNPDGYARYVQFYRSTRGRQPQPAAQSTEHDEPWPYGRVNHYHFDLNRDWLWQTQVESRARLAAYLNWRPHVHVDFHEMYPGSHYFFPPATKPYLSEFQPWQSDLQKVFGNHNADYFDANQWLYYSHRDFDLFYPSYGDTYPMLQGALGMTYEQEGHQVAGLIYRKKSGDTLRLKDRIIHHHTAAMATVEKAAELRDQLLKNQQQFYRQKSSSSAYYIYSPNDSVLSLQTELEHLLQQNEIPFERVTAIDEGRIGRPTLWKDLATGEKVERKLKKGDVLIPVRKSYPLNRILLSGQHSEDTQAALEADPVGDLTCWSAAYFIGDLYRVDRLQKVGLSTVDGSLGSKGKQFSAPPANYGYALGIHSSADHQRIIKLLASGIRLRYSKKAWAPMDMEQVKLAPGSILVLARDNTAKDLVNVAKLLGPRAIPLHSARTAYGPNLGYPVFPLLNPPRIALLRSDAFDTYAYGHAWHYLDQHWTSFYHALSPEKFFQKAADYSVVILPGGWSGGTEKQVRQLRDYVENGGTLIVLGSSVKVFGNSEFWNIENKPYPDHMVHSDKPGGFVTTQEWNRGDRLQQGMPDRYYALVRGNQRLVWDEKLAVLGHSDEAADVCGYVTDRFQDYLKGTMGVARESAGKGEGLFFVDDPLFRGFWSRGHQLMTNAILFKP
jgi:hypothetical protein